MFSMQLNQYLTIFFVFWILSMVSMLTCSIYGSKWILFVIHVLAKLNYV